jgi:hypothetical protein
MDAAPLGGGTAKWGFPLIAGLPVEVAMRRYVQISGLLFGLVTLGHLLRVVRRWPMLIADRPVPALLSLVVLVVTGLMAAWAWRLLSKPPQPGA